MRIAADVGGTFTDVFFTGDQGTLGTFKVLTTHDDPLAGIERGIRRGLDELGHPPPGEKVTFIHGTTLVANAIIERKGHPVTLLVTEGFEDTLDLGDESRYDIYDLNIDFPAAPVHRDDVVGVRGRLAPDGTEAEPLDLDHLRAALEGHALSSVAVCLLHSYASAEHEMAVAQVIGELAPDAEISLSSEVAPEIREYLRTMTTAVNAYVKPLMRPYLSRIGAMLTELFGEDKPTTIMLSDGGLVPPELAGRFPVRVVESGPAAGALAAHKFAERGSLPTGHLAVALDMGGTTAKIAFLDGEQDLALENTLEVARHYQLKQGSGLPLLISSVDLVEIGAGGGSLAHIDGFGLLEVGPESAGSEPGPAAYGLGGTQPTVTDANVVLGYIPSWQRLGGHEPVHADLAKAAVSGMGQRLDMETRQTAVAIRAVADEHMASAIRVSAAERGLDPESFTIVAFGGAAPLHACGVADRVGIGAVALPAEPGVLSAAGLASAPLAFDTVRTHRVLLDEVAGLGEIEDLYQSMRGELEARFSAYATPEELVLHRTAGMRFRGQRDELDVRVPDGAMSDPSTVEGLVQAFRNAYLQHYARYPEATIEITNWRLRAETHGEPLDTSAVRPESRPDYVPDETAATFVVDGQLTDVVAQVKWRPDLEPGDSGSGPALLLEKHTTGVVPPSWSWLVRADRALIITRNREDNR